MLVLRKVKQLLSNFEAERWENLSNLRLAKKSVAYKKTLVYLGRGGPNDFENVPNSFLTKSNWKGF